MSSHTVVEYLLRSVCLSRQPEKVTCLWFGRVYYELASSMRIWVSRTVDTGPIWFANVPCAVLCPWPWKLVYVGSAVLVECHTSVTCAGQDVYLTNRSVTGLINLSISISFESCQEISIPNSRNFPEPGNWLPKPKPGGGWEG